MSDPMITLLGKLPFMMLLTENGKKQIKPNWTRLFELSVAIAAILWTLSNNMSRIETKVDSIGVQVQTLDQRLYEHMKENRR